MLSKEKEKRISILEARLMPRPISKSIDMMSIFERTERILKIIKKYLINMQNKEFLDLMTEIDYLRKKSGLAIYDFKE